MYTMHGLRDFLKRDMEKIPMNYYNDAISNFKEFMEGSKDGLSVLKERFGKVMEYDFDQHFLLLEEHAQHQKAGATEVDRNTFVHAFESAEKMLDYKREVFSAIKEELFSLPKRKLSEPSYFVLKANGEAIHQLGLLNRTIEDYFTAFEETDEYYIGSFWYSNFIGVYFRKTDARPLTEEEKLTYI